MSGIERSADAVKGPADAAEQVERLRALVDRTRPVSLAEQHVLPVLPTIEPIFDPGPIAGGSAHAGLRRGSVVTVGGPTGATALALALAAGPTRSGSWAAFVGLPELGWAAAAELGVDLDRVVVVRPPDRSRVTVVAALVDAFDVVVCGFDGAPSSTEARRLTARARERGSVLVVVGGLVGGVGRARRSWPGAPDAELTVVDSTWTGPDEGAGHLRERRVTVEVGGRRALARPRRIELMLPGPSGAPVAVATSAQDRSERHAVVGSAAERSATVTPLRRVG